MRPVRNQDQVLKPICYHTNQHPGGRDESDWKGEPSPALLSSAARLPGIGLTLAG